MNVQKNIIPRISSTTGRYAKSLYLACLGSKENKLEKILQDFDSFLGLLNRDKIFAKIFNNHFLELQVIEKIINQVGALMNLSGLFVNFLKTLYIYKKSRFIKNIYTDFKTIYNNQNNIIEVKVYSKNHLQENQKIDIDKYLQKKFKANIFTDYYINPEILGGILIKTDRNVVIDATVNSMLQDIKKIIWKG